MARRVSRRPFGEGWRIRHWVIYFATARIVTNTQMTTCTNDDPQNHDACRNSKAGELPGPTELLVDQPPHQLPCHEHDRCVEHHHVPDDGREELALGLFSAEPPARQPERERLSAWLRTRLALTWVPDDDREDHREAVAGLVGPVGLGSPAAQEAEQRYVAAAGEKAPRPAGVPFRRP